MRYARVPTATPPFTAVVELAEGEALPLGGTIVPRAELETLGLVPKDTFPVAPPAADLKPGQTFFKSRPAIKTTRPLPVVGDKITVAGKPGVISEVKDGEATRFKMAHGEINTETEAVTFLYADPVKAKADAEWQKVK